MTAKAHPCVQMRNALTKRGLWVLFLLLGTLLLFLPDAPVTAAPPGAGTPGGIVYFRHDNEMWQMNPDGSNRAPFPNMATGYGDPSHLRHAGQRWFIWEWDVPGVIFPNGRYKFTCWAGNESGATVLLLDQPDMEVLSPPRWVAGDQKVSFMGERWLLDGTGQPTQVVESGLYTLDIAYDAAGSVLGAVPGSLTLHAELSTPLRIGPGGFTSTGEVAGHSHGTSTQFAFSLRMWGGMNVQEVWTLDLSKVTSPPIVPALALRLLASGNGIGWPEWSPDGKYIGYVGWDGTFIYDVTRNRSKKLADTGTQNWGKTIWSPSGSHFVIYRWDSVQTTYDAIFRFKADLTGKTELTAGLCPPGGWCVLIPAGWRN